MRKKHAVRSKIYSLNEKAARRLVLISKLKSEYDKDQMAKEYK